MTPRVSRFCLFLPCTPSSFPPKLYSGPTIQSRSAARRVAQDLVYIKAYIDFLLWTPEKRTFKLECYNMVFWIGTNVGFWTSYVSSHKSFGHVPSFYRLVVEDISSAGAGRYTCQVVLLVSFKHHRKERWLVTQKRRRQEGRRKRKKTTSYSLSLLLTSIRASFLFFSFIFLSLFLVCLLVTLSPRVE